MYLDPGQPFSIRLREHADLLVRDDVRRSGRSRSVVVEELAEEAAKARLFPGVAFVEDSRRPLDELSQLYPFLQTGAWTGRVRLLLDAHVSGPNVGRRLQQDGHDVRALDQEAALEGLDDDDVLALAATEQRILVTHNVADFPRILREWASGQRTHAGVILIDGIDHSEFGLIVRGIERWLQLRPAQADWSDFPVILDRRFARG